MSGLLVIRRLHLYLGLFLLPWVIVFGVSSLPLNHTSLQRPVTWTPRATMALQLEVPPDADLRAVGRQILEASGLGGEGGFNVSRPNPRQVVVNRPRFLGFTRVTYRLDQQQLTVEDRSTAWPQFLSAMHTRAGFYLGSFGNIVWAVMVDVLCAGLLIWIATGLYMWWQIPASRWWGWLAIAGGLGCCAAIISSL
jgi:hypothetical protein